MSSAILGLLTETHPEIRIAQDTVPGDSAQMPTNYVPRLIDTASVLLPSPLIALTEHLAENAHDLWAAQRHADGWT